MIETPMVSAVIPESLVKATATNSITPSLFNVVDYLVLVNQEVGRDQ